MSGGPPTTKNAATLILNVCPDLALLQRRSRVLNEAGYYTTSARTAQESIHLAAGMDCSVALICYSLAGKEKSVLLEQLRKISPRTTIICLDSALDNQRILVSLVEQALAQ